MSDPFEEIVSASLDDVNYREVKAPVAYNASVSAGMLFPHGPNCICDNRVLIISFKIEGSDIPLELAVVPSSALGHAILTGTFGELCESRLKTIDN